jgi:hypothetical protein
MYDRFRCGLVSVADGVVVAAGQESLVVVLASISATDTLYLGLVA